MQLPLLERAAPHDGLFCLTPLGRSNAAPSQLETPRIPSRLPGPGEQFRFHFDMARCIGCHCCEVACNEQNGNPATVRWRRVGEIEGGSYPFTQRFYLSMGWIIATNPVVSFPNYALLEQALESLEFLVVQDGFYPTPTAEFAHLVLPAAIWGEKEGTYTNSERRCSKVNKAVDPPGFVETNSNLVTQSAYDPISREPNFKQCAVRVEKTAPGGKR